MLFRFSDSLYRGVAILRLVDKLLYEWIVLSNGNSHHPISPCLNQLFTA